MTEKIFKSALTLTLGFAVCAYADPFHSENFSDYADGYSITNAPSWTGGAEDESKVVEANDNKYLALNTNGGELINTLSNPDDINDAKDAGIYFEAKVKFVPSDTLTDLSDLAQPSSDAKFAIYALAEENGPTNLVVFHKFYDGSDYPTTNEVFTSVSLPDDTVTVRVDYKKEAYYNEGAYLFKVSIGGTPITSGCPYYADAQEGSDAGVEDWACWMQTVNNSDISSVCFKGTGEVDDIVVDAATVTPTTYTVTFESEGVTVGTTNVVAGETVVAPAPTKEHYHLTGWTLSGSAYDFATPVNDNITLVAVWAIDTHSLTITYTGAGADTPAQYVGSFAYGASYSVASPVIAGYDVDVATVTGTMGDVDVAVTVTYSAIQQADWEANPAEITDGTPAATQYPALADSALATADAKKLTVWAKANNIDFAAVEADTTGAYVNAFLLNCDPADVATEEAAFVLNITFDNGVPVVSTPADRNEKTYNVTPVLKGKAALTDAEWTTINDTDANDANDTEDFQFFKAELSL